MHEPVKEKQKDLLTLLQNNTDWLVISRLSKRHYFDDIQKSISNRHLYFTTLTTLNKSWFPSGRRQTRITSKYIEVELCSQKLKKKMAENN